MATPIPPNAADFTLEELETATRGRCMNTAEVARVLGVCTDTRAVRPGQLFVALKGERHDGHAHLDEARRLGASAAVVQRGTEWTGPRIEVDDTLEALGELARAFVRRARRSRARPTVAITGSAGKTTTKELTTAAVRAVFGPTLSTIGNLNNRVGVPMTLLTLRDEHRALVIECGTNARGEIAALGAIVEPDVSVVLNADAGHTAGLGTIEDVADEKGALFAAASKMVVANADDPASLGRVERATVPAITFGAREGSDVRLVERRAAMDGTLELRIDLPAHMVVGTTPSVRVHLAIAGHGAALDAAAALAALVALHGPLSREQLGAATGALASVRPIAGRFSPIAFGTSLVIDDTYNANPRSMRTSIDAAAELAASVDGRLVLVLGDMLELGDQTERWHAELGAQARRVRAAVFVAFGDAMAVAARTVAQAGNVKLPIVVHARMIEHAVALVRDLLAPRDVVLVKGSRGMQMERFVALLTGTRA